VNLKEETDENLLLGGNDVSYVGTFHTDVCQSVVNWIEKENCGTDMQGVHTGPTQNIVIGLL
jgi:hypothetical protein